MDSVGNKKMLNMLILDVLKEYSDAEHRLTQQEIMRILLADHETECDRRSVKNNVLYLKELGYEINMDDGYYLEKRDFENDEIQFLIDCIASSTSKKLNKKRKRELVEKLIKEGNKYFEPKEPEISESVGAQEEIKKEAEVEKVVEVAQPEIKVEPTIEIKVDAAPVIEIEDNAEETIRVRFSAPNDREEELHEIFGDNYKVMANHKETFEFSVKGTEEKMYTWAMLHNDIEVLAPDNFRVKIAENIKNMDEMYNHKVAGFFKKGIFN